MLKAVLKVALVVALVGPSGLCFAQPFPAKPVRIVVPFPPGGGVDALGRIVGERLSTLLGQPVIVDNRAGAGGAIGTDAAAKAPADGYTLLVGSSGTLSMAPSINPRLPYKPMEDFAPLTLGVVNSNILVVRNSFPAATLAELIALAQKSPGKLTFASGGVGTSQHLNGELFRLMAKLDIVHVPYKGTAPAVNDLIGGQTDMFFSDPSVVSLVKAGKLRALAQTSPSRSALLPDLPTIAESGVPGYSATAWYAFFAPAGTPAPILTRLSTDVVTALQAPEVKAKLAVAGMVPQPSTPQELAALLREDTQRWADVVKAAGIKVDP